MTRSHYLTMVLSEAWEMFTAALRGERGADSWPNFGRYLAHTLSNL